MRGHITASKEVLFLSLKVEPVLPWSLCLAPMLDWLFMRLVTTSNSWKEIRLILSNQKADGRLEYQPLRRRCRRR